MLETQNEVKPFSFRQNPFTLGQGKMQLPKDWALFWTRYEVKVKKLINLRCIQYLEPFRIDWFLPRTSYHIDSPSSCLLLLINPFTLPLLHTADYQKRISIANQPDAAVFQIYLFDLTIYMFRTVLPSIIRSSRLYIQQQVYVKLKLQRWVELLVNEHIGCNKV
jgi:hypothetical protein